MNRYTQRLSLTRQDGVHRHTRMVYTENTHPETTQNSSNVNARSAGAMKSRGSMRVVADPS